MGSSSSSSSNGTNLYEQTLRLALAYEEYAGELEQTSPNDSIYPALMAHATWIRKKAIMLRELAKSF